jgi:hypothetical protein
MLIAYHGRESDKAAILAELARHREADRLVQGYGYWSDGKGCAVGCTLQSDDHMLYESRFGIPVAIALLEDAIFEGLPVDLARQWPERLMSSIRVGADLSRILWKLLHWILTTPAVNPGIEHPIVRDAAQKCADIIADLASGKMIDREAAESAFDGAWAAEIAACAAWRAVRSATSTESAENAAWSAVKSAESVASAAWVAFATSAESAARRAACVARSASAAASAESTARAAWTSISDKLIELIVDAPNADG